LSLFAALQSLPFIRTQSLVSQITCLVKFVPQSKVKRAATLLAIPKRQDTFLPALPPLLQNETSNIFVNWTRLSLHNKGIWIFEIAIANNQRHAVQRVEFKAFCLAPTFTEIPEESAFPTKFCIWLAHCLYFAGAMGLRNIVLIASSRTLCFVVALLWR